MILFETPRLRVMSLDAKLTRLALHDMIGFAEALDVRVNPDWPSSDMLDLLGYLLPELEKTPGSQQHGGVIVRKATYEVIGDIGLHQLSGDLPKLEKGAEVGYSVVPDHRNDGVATEALIGLTKWAFERMGLLRLYAHCDRLNVPSQRVLAKAGFTLVPAGLDKLVLFECVPGVV